VAEAIGGERVGIRVSPAANLHGAIEDEPAETAATYRALIDGIAPLGLAYLHTIGDPAGPLLRDLRARFGGPLVVNDGWIPVTSESTARRRVEGGQADLVAVGRAFIANPDLIRRWQHHAALTEPDSATFYGGDERGYTDYPSLPEMQPLTPQTASDIRGGMSTRGKHDRDRESRPAVPGAGDAPADALGLAAGDRADRHYAHGAVRAVDVVMAHPG
jgi:hypothetical protein